MRNQGELREEGSPASRAGWGGALQGDFHASPLQACSISLLTRQLPPLPDPPTAPKVEEGCESLWEPRKILKPVS